MEESADKVLYRQRRRKFATKSYLLTGAALILALAQWCLLYFVKAANIFLTRKPWVGCIFFAIGLLLLVLFIFFEALRFNKKINWVFALLILECIVLGTAPLVVRQLLYPFFIGFAVWTLALIIFILCGTFIPFDLTVNVVVLFVFAVTAIIGAIYFLMIYVVINVPYSFLVFCSLIILSIWMFVMYHAQIINGGRFAEMRTKDYFLAALILFLDFILMYLFSFQIAPKWSDRCDINHQTTGSPSYGERPQDCKYCGFRPPDIHILYNEPGFIVDNREQNVPKEALFFVYFCGFCVFIAM